MFNFQVYPQDDGMALICWDGNLIEDEDNESGMKRLLLEVTHSFDEPFLKQALLKLFKSAEINGITIKEQAEKWLSHPSNPAHEICAGMVHLTTLEGRLCSGSVGVPLDVLYPLCNSPYANCEDVTKLPDGSLEFNLGKGFKVAFKRL